MSFKPRFSRFTRDEGVWLLLLLYCKMLVSTKNQYTASHFIAIKPTSLYNILPVGSSFDNR